MDLFYPKRFAKNLFSDRLGEAAWRFRLQFLLIFLFVAGFLPATGQDTLRVGATYTHTTIQGAINAASDGDVILVDPGTYNEEITIAKPLTLLGAKHGVDPRPMVGSTRSLEGAGESVIEQPATMVAVSIQSSNVTIDGFFLRHQGMIGADKANLVETPSNTPRTGFVFRNNIIIGVDGDGVNIKGFSAVSIANNYIKDTFQDGICLADDLGGDNHVIRDNQIINSQSNHGGIFIYNINGVLIEKNKIENSKGGIRVSRSTGAVPATNVTIHKNEIIGTFASGSGSEWGITVQGSVTDVVFSEHIDIQYNRIQQVGGSATSALTLFSAYGRVSDLKFKNNFLSRETGNIYLRVGTSGGGNGENVQIDARCNWYGSSEPTTVESRIQYIADPAVYTPFITSGLDAEGGDIGFVPTIGSCLEDLPISVYTDRSLTTRVSTHNAIQEAVNSAQPNQVVYVKEGSYAEEVTIDKPLTLLGAQHGVDPRPKVNSSRGMSGPQESIITVTKNKAAILISSGGVTVDGFQIAHSGGSGGNDLITTPSAFPSEPWDNIEITNTIFHDAADEAIQLRNVSKALISRNWIVAPQGDGVNLSQSLTGSGNKIYDNEIEDCNSPYASIYLYGVNDVEVKGNSITGHGNGMMIGEEAGGNQVSNIVVEENEIQSQFTAYIARGYGIAINNVLTQNITIRNNKIIEQAGGASAMPVDKFSMIWITNNPQNVVIQNNYLQHEEALAYRYIYAEPTVTNLVDAECNWYGSTSFADVLTRVIGPNIKFAPYLKSDANEATFGFTPVSGACSVPVHNQTQNTYYATIQSAVSVANPGDVIYASAGIYSEPVVIDRPLTLLGAKHGVDPRPVSSTRTVDGADETIIRVALNQKAISIQSGDVTINGFQIDQVGGSGKSDLVESIASATPWNNVQLLNNIVKNASDEGIQLRSVNNALISKNYLLGVQGDAINISSNLAGVGNQILDNEIVDCNSEYGSIYLYQVKGVEIKRNLIRGHNNGINLGAGDPDHQVVDIVIEANEIHSQFTAYIARGYGIAIYNSQTNNILIKNNKIIELTGGSQMPVDKFAMIWIGDNPQNVVIQNNYLQHEEALAYRYIYAEPSVTNLVDASCNWYGTTESSEMAARISGSSVKYIPYLSSGTDEVGEIGFTPEAGACTGPVKNRETGLAYQTIQEAIDDAATLGGHHIDVSNGLYVEQVDVTKGVRIVGESRDGVIIRPVAGDAEENVITFLLKAPNIRIENLTITRSGLAVKADDNSDASGFRMDQVSVTDSRIGVSSFVGGTGVFADIQITNSLFDYTNATYYPTNGHKAVYFQKASQLLIENLTVNKVGNGGSTGQSGGVDIDLRGPGSYSDITIRNSVFTQSATSGPFWENGEGGGAIQVKASGGATVSNVLIEDNTVEDAHIALHISSTNPVIVKKNKLLGVRRSVVNSGTGNIVLICNWFGTTDVAQIHSDRLVALAPSPGTYFTLASYAADETLATCTDNCGIVATIAGNPTPYANNANIPEGTITFTSEAGYDSYTWFACANPSACNVPGSFSPNNSSAVVARSFQLGAKGVRLVRTVGGETYTCFFFFNVIPTVKESNNDGCSATLTRQGSGGTATKWYKDGALIEGATSNTYIATESGDYTVAVTVDGADFVSEAYTLTLAGGSPVYSFKVGSEEAVSGSEFTACQGVALPLELTLGPNTSYVLEHNGTEFASGGSGTTLPFYPDLDQAGTWKLTISRDLTGCESVLEFTLNVNPKPRFTSATVDKAEVCLGGDPAIVTITGLVPNVESVLAYELGGYPGTFAVTADASGVAELSSSLLSTPAAGNYTITVTEVRLGECYQPVTANNVISLNILAQPTFGNVAISKAAICAEDTDPAIITISGLLPSVLTTLIYDLNGEEGSFQVTSGADGSVALPTSLLSTPAAGEYTVTIKEVQVGNCSVAVSSENEVSLTIYPVVTMSAIDDEIAIVGHSVTGIPFTSSIPGVSFSWSVTNHSILGLASSTGSGLEFPSFTPSAAGTATVTVIPSIGGCEGTPVSFEIEVQPAPDLGLSIEMFVRSFTSSILSRPLKITVYNTVSSSVTRDPVSIVLLKPNNSFNLVLAPDVDWIVTDNGSFWTLTYTGTGIAYGAAEDINATLSIPNNNSKGSMILSGVVLGDSNLSNNEAYIQVSVN